MTMRIFGDADRTLLPEGRLAGPMPWVIAIMMGLAMLAAAAGLALGGAARSLEGGNRITVQIVSADAAARSTQAEAALAMLRTQPGIRSVRRIADADIAALLQPWLGNAASADIPLPAVIEAELALGAAQRLEPLRKALATAAPAARLDANAQWLAPVAGLVAALRWLAAGLVLLMATAMAATVVLAARAALDTHRAVIEVLHLMGATDGQVAALFQRRIALDALFGAAVGFAGASLLLWLLGRKLAVLGSELIGSVELPVAGWLALLALPLFTVLLAMLVARITVLRALTRL
jgi:cell division transport system permease protein